MPQVELPILANWLVTGFIGLIFGVIGGWAKYRFDRKRDDVAWERDRSKLQEERQHQEQLLERQFRQRLEELEYKFRDEEEKKLENALSKALMISQKK